VTRRRDEDLDREIRAHLELEAADREADGLSPEDARRAARRLFGNPAVVREDARAVWAPLWIQQAGQDARYAWRLARRTPAFTIGVLFVIALGIGATTTIFSALRAVVLAPLPFDRPLDLVRVSQMNAARGVADFSVSLPLYREWRDRSTSWRDLAATRTDTVVALGLGEPRRLDARFETWNLLPLLGVHVRAGRGFSAADDARGAAPVAILSNRLWRDAFAAAPDVVGRALTIDGRPTTIIGIAPANGTLVGDADVLLPLVPSEGDVRFDYSDLDVIGRLASGVTMTAARAEMTALTERVAAELVAAGNQGDVTGWTPRLLPLHEAVVGTAAPRTLSLLFVAAVVLLLVACANVSGLLLARASGRAHEMAVRAALGGGRGRIVRQLLVETGCLALGGALLGLAMSTVALPVLKAGVLSTLPRANDIRIDGGVLMVALVSTLLTAVLAGLAPAFRASQLNVQASLKANAPAVAGGPRLSRRVLIASQLALSIVLLTTAGLAARALSDLRSVDLGFSPDHVLSMAFAPERAPELTTAAFLERLRRLPGVESVAATSAAPMGAGNASLHVFPVGPAILAPTTAVQADWRVASPGYFHTMGTPILAGRDFTAHDDSRSAKVIIVNETLARQMWGRDNPIGRQLDLGGGGGEPATVVGLVRDVRAHSPAVPPAPTYYVSLYRGVWGPVTVVIRTRADASGVVPLARAELHALDPAAPLFDVMTMRQRVEGPLTPQRLLMGLLAGFALAATLLAVIGMYGLVSYATGQRLREIALRVALGASRGHVVRLLLGEGVRLVTVGIAVGVLLAVPAARAVHPLLTGAGTSDPAMFGVAVAVLSLASLAACAIPIRRALRANPAVVLRGE
jgi:putative ABC transport system permease protein